MSIQELEQGGAVRLFRGNVISKKDMAREPGECPVYSSSVHNNGLFGRYGRFMFDEELITWSVDGGGHFFYRPRHRFSVTNVCGYMRVNASSVDCHFLSYQLQRLHGQLSFDYTLKAHPSVIRGLYVVPLPGIEEQRSIAEALSDADALIESLEQLLTKKRQLKQGAMQVLLTGKKRLPGFSGEWQLKRLGEMLTICHGKGQHDVEALSGPYPILASGGEIGRSNRFLYDKPSVLIGRKGTIDQPQYMDTPFWTVDTLFYSVVHQPNHAKFLFYRFCLVNWRQHNEASGVPSLNARTIEAIEIRSPGPDEQIAIAEVLSDLDVEIGALAAQLGKARLLKQGMMQELLTGRTRLV